MSTADDVTRARQQLDEQMRQIGGLRNASTRDSGFKQWRQNTLTLIQRLWPGDPARAERFRRVRFSAPFSRATEAQTRDYYQRACAESTKLLRLLIDEVDAFGVSAAGLEAGLEEPLPLSPDELEVTLESEPEEVDDPRVSEIPSLPPRPATPARPVQPPPAAAAEPAAPARRIPPPTTAEAEPAARARAVEPPHAAEDAPAPSARAPRASRRGTGQTRLRDMLGFTESPPATGAAHPETQAPEETEAPRASTTRSAPSTPAEPTPTRSAGEDDHARKHATAKFLSNSLVLRLQGKPVRRVTKSGVPQSAAALAMTAFATQIEQLSVPEADLPRVRAGLLDLARHLDAHDLRWNELRKALGWVMEYPALARRVVPLLLPFLDDAA